MKRAVIIILSLIVFLTSHASNHFGAGIYAGNPTGIKLKVNLNQNNSINSIIAWDIPASMVYGSFGYSYNFYYSVKSDDGEITLPLFFYTGPGIRIKTNNNTNVGVKFTAGAGLQFPDIPIELFIECSPILDVIPATSLDFNAGIGFIFYFL